MVLPSQKPDELNRGKGNSACSGSLHDEFGGGQLLSELEISQYVPALVPTHLLCFIPTVTYRLQCTEMRRGTAALFKK